MNHNFGCCVAVSIFSFEVLIKHKHVYASAKDISMLLFLRASSTYQNTPPAFKTWVPTLFRSHHHESYKGWPAETYIDGRGYQVGV